MTSQNEPDERSGPPPGAPGTEANADDSATHDAAVAVAHGEPADTFGAAEEQVERALVGWRPSLSFMIGLVALLVLIVWLALLQFT